MLQLGKVYQGSRDELSEDRDVKGMCGVCVWMLVAQSLATLRDPVHFFTESPRTLRNNK